MPTPTAAIPRDLETRLRSLEVGLREANARLLSRKQLSVTEGDFVVSGGGNVVILDVDGNVAWDALNSPSKPMSYYAEVNSMDLAATWTEYGAHDVEVPPNYNTVHVMMNVSAGASFAVTTANVSVQPVIGVDNWGPAINSGSGAIAVASSFWAQTLTGLGPTLRLAVRAVRSSSAPIAGTSNWHMAASLIFTRT